MHLLNKSAECHYVECPYAECPMPSVLNILKLFNDVLIKLIIEIAYLNENHLFKIMLVLTKGLRCEFCKFHF